MMNPKYSLFTTRGETFLLSGRKRANKQTSNYLISIDAEDLERDSKSFFGKVRSNVSGTEFVIYNNGCKPGEERPEGPFLREELGAVLYETNIAGTKGPRKMTVILPAVQSDDTRKRWQPRSDDDGLIAEYRRNPESAELVVLVNKEPTWNEQLRSYQLNFHGRVTKPSVKNFQLCDAKQPGKVVMQFGKVEDSKFNLDFNHPVSPVQAFGICLTAFDNKLACQ
jgi:tubby-related protein 1